MSLLSPRSIAVIGASTDEHKVGHLILKNLLTQGFKGEVYPVNPKGGMILDHEAIKEINAIKEPVDLAVIVTPAETVLDLAKQCGEKGVQSLIVISAGFGESGEEGKKREKELVDIAKRHTMQLVGPNCLGVMRPSIGMNASFGNILPKAGNVAFLSQSGALGEAFIDRAGSIGLGFSFFVSMGNKAAMDECDYLAMAAEDPETDVIGLYLENIGDGNRFLKLARDVTEKKPIVLLKAGTTERGRSAASSHTGALAGSDAAVEAVCTQGGIHRARTAEEFLSLLRTLSTQPPLPGSRIAVITNAGGPGVLAADAAEREGLELPPLPPKYASALAKSLPPAASVGNPIDVLGDALADRFEMALRTAAQAENIDGAAVILTPQVMTPTLEIAKKIAEITSTAPLFPCVTCFMGGEGVAEAVTYLHAHGIPNFSSPEEAIAMLAALRQTKGQDSTAEVKPMKKRTTEAAAIVKGVTGLLDEERTAKLLQLYKLPLPQGKVATNRNEAVKIAREIGLPVVAKVSSKDILHKTEIGGVRVNLESEEDVGLAFDEIIRNAKEKAPTANVQGVLIQKFLTPGNEFIVGALRDPSVGHLVMTGLGGIYTELFRDTSFRVAPLSPESAYPMLAKLRSWKLLLGLRGKAQLNIDALAQLVSTVSLLAVECPGIKEIDLNPVLVTEKELTVLDAKVVMG